MPKIKLESKKIVVVDGERIYLSEGEQEVSAEIAKELGIETPKSKPAPKREAE